METNKLDFSAIERAGLSQRDAANFLRISRVTVNKYCNGHVQPHPLVAEKVARFLALLETRIAEGKLPIDMPLARQEQRETRLALIRAALQ